MWATSRARGYCPQDNMPTERLHTRILTPDGLVWEGNVDAVSSKNSEGSFDILPEHANFITYIEGPSIVVRTGSGAREFAFDKAVIALRDNVASIYANIESKDVYRRSS